MPAKGGAYALYQRKLLRENLLQEVSTHRSRAREAEKYQLAAQRNNLEKQRQNLRVGLERLPIGVCRYYMQRVDELTERIDASKKRFPNFRGLYDD